MNGWHIDILRGISCDEATESYVRGRYVNYSHLTLTTNMSTMFSTMNVYTGRKKSSAFIAFDHPRGVSVPASLLTLPLVCLLR